MSFPVYDPVCVLIETPFSRWSENDKKDFLSGEKPMPCLDVSKEIKWKDKKCIRRFKSQWYTQYSWLCGSYYLKKLFCLPCMMISSKSGVWVSKGFGDMGNVSRSFQMHESSGEHLRCAVGFKKLRLNLNTIQDALRENSRLYIQQYNERVQLNRRFMQLPIRATVFLSKQELPFRGHYEGESSSNRGNFKELLTDYIAISPADIQEHYKKIAPVFSANSKTIQNELIDCISDYIQSFIEKEIKECDFISIQVDDTTDICQKSQCSVIFRYVVPGGIVKERFLGFFNVSSDRSADTLFNIVLSCLEKYDCRSKLVGQCYDGASVMAGHLNGLQAKVKEIAPQAIFVHCLAHRLNLVLQQSCYNISRCRIFFANVSGLPAFFHHSAKRTYTADSVMGRRLPTTVVTRWSSYSRIVSIINNEWESLKQVFEAIINEGGSDQVTLRQCDGFLKNFADFEFVILIIIFSDIFALVDVLFDVLQKKSFDINYCISQIKQFQELIKKKRNENDFKKIFDLALLRALPSSKHQEGRSRVTYTEDQIFNKYKVLFYEILDNVLMQIITRFEDVGKIKFVTLFDVKNFKNFSEHFPIDGLQNLKEFYPNIFTDTKLYRLKSELELIYASEEYRGIDPQNVLKLLSDNSDIFKETYKLFALILTIPSTSVSAERSFSCLKRIKTYLRNAIGQERLSNLARISIETELLCELMTTQPFYDDIIDKFANLKDRRIDLILKK